MSITHDNSGTRRTQAQRDAARLIEAGEFIAADTPAGQAVIDALEEAARRVRTRDHPRHTHTMKEKSAAAHVRAFGQCIEVSFPWPGSEYEINRAVSTAAKRLSEIACDERDIEAATVCVVLGIVPRLRLVCVSSLAEVTRPDGSTETFIDDAPVIVDGGTFGKWGASIMAVHTTDTRNKK